MMLSTSKKTMPTWSRCSAPGQLGPRISPSNQQYGRRPRLSSGNNISSNNGREVVAAMTITEAKAVIELTAESIDSFLKTHAVTVVDYYTPWCGPCKVMAPVFDSLAQNLDIKVHFAKFDCGLNTENKQFAIEAGIKALPTFHLYRGAEKVAEMYGAKPEKLQEMVEYFSDDSS